MAKKKLLYLAYTLPEYNAATGDRHATGMLEELSKDFDIHLAAARCTAPEHHARHSGYAARIHVGDLRGTLEALSREGIDFSFVVLERAGLHHLLPVLGMRFPRAKTVVNAIDIEYRRECGVAAMADKYGVGPDALALLSPTPASTRKLELALYRRADYIVTVSDDDREFLVRDGIPARKILVCRIPQPLADAAYDPDGRYLTFVGYAHHVPNYLSVKAFIDTVFPHLEGYCSSHDLRLAIIGGDCRGRYAALRRDRLVEAPGHLDLAEIRARYYPHTCLSLAPLVAGSGVKGKILEAMAHRLPVVTTDVGLQGLAQFRDCVIRIDMDDPRGAADAIRRSLEDREGRRERSKRAARKLVEYGSSGEDLPSLRARLDQIARTPASGGPLRDARRFLQPFWWWFAR